MIDILQIIQTVNVGTLEVNFLRYALCKSTFYLLTFTYSGGVKMSSRSF